MSLSNVDTWQESEAGPKALKVYVVNSDGTSMAILPPNASTESTLVTLLTETTFTSLTPPPGQAVASASSPVVLASDQSAIPVTGPLTNTQLRATAVPVTASVSNFPATQAVTGPLTDTQLRAGAVPVSGTVSVSNFPATQPVSGTITAIGPLTDTQLRASSVPVSGTFFPATQPVSGTVSVSNFPATQAVTGTFFQATQPVSGTVTATGPLTDTQLRASAITVSGTFFQATQPVSGTVTATGPLTDTQLRAIAVPVSGTVTATGPLTDTQLRASPVPVSGTVTASVSNFPATQAVSGTVAVNNFPATQPVSGTVTATGPLTDTQLRASAVPISGTVAASVSNFPATQAVTGTFFPTTQAVSVSASTRATYSASVAGQANTAASHAIALEAGASKKILLRKIIVNQAGNQTTAGVRLLLLERTTGAGTAGAVAAQAANATAASLVQLDPSTGVFSGIMRAKPTSLGAQGATVLIIPVFVPAAIAAYAAYTIDLENLFGSPVVVAAGTSNGIALRDPGATGGANFSATFIFTEE